MTSFQRYAVALTAIWFLVTLPRFRRSAVVLLGGLSALGLFTLAAWLSGEVSLRELGLGVPTSWLVTVGLAVGWLVLMLAYSPLADRLATRLVDEPPSLGAFRALQRSTARLLAGIVAAWVIGGFLEELISRGVVLQAVRALGSPRLGAPVATAVAVGTAAAGAGLMHLYQGRRAVLIVTQLSALFGLLFVVSGYNLWTVILCHGLYDTVAFVRFATGRSRYATAVDR
jgi:membrane protease YdiL (CAAX protease family)